ncbi:putative TPT domain-containing protein [Aphanomyces euteiches]|nr:putative TPT domain-containing protein [Aphanomyces euteiches]
MAFSAMGQSNGGRDAGTVLMGCLNTVIAAAFYGGNYGLIKYHVTTTRTTRALLKDGHCLCFAHLDLSNVLVLPQWTHVITEPVIKAQGNPMHILGALGLYTLSQLAHGLTYFMMLGSCGAVTTGIMQSLRAVCVFGLSSVLYCSRQESQCFDAKRGIATLFVVSGVLFYSWAKGQTKIRKPIDASKLPKHYIV